MESKTYFSLRRSVNVVPINNRVLLHRGQAKSLWLDSNEIDVLTILELLQKGVTFEELTAYSNNVGIDVLISLLQRLQKAKVLYHPKVLTDLEFAQLERYDRLLAYLGELESSTSSRFDLLKRIQESHIVLLGIGTLASWVLLHLAGNGVSKITAVDGDVVELSNLSRQALYAEEDVGVKKIIAAQRAVNRLSKQTSFTGIDHTITSEDNVRDILESVKVVNIIVLTADRPPRTIARWVAAAAFQKGIPLIRANMRGVGPLMIPGNTACPACDLPRLKSQIPNADDLIAYKSSNKVPSMANSAAISTEISVYSSILAHEIFTFLSEADNLNTLNQQIKIRLTHGVSLEINEFPRDPHCPVCGQP